MQPYKNGYQLAEMSSSHNFSGKRHGSSIQIITSFLGKWQTLACSQAFAPSFENHLENKKAYYFTFQLPKNGSVISLIPSRSVNSQ